MATMHTEEHYRKNWARYLAQSQINLEQMLTDEMNSLRELSIKANTVEAIQKMKVSLVYNLALADILKRKAIIMDREMTGRNLPKDYKTLYEFDCLQLHDFKLKHQQGTR